MSRVAPAPDYNKGEQNFPLVDREEILNDLNKIEENLQLLLNFYTELESVREKRKSLAATVIQKERVQNVQEKRTQTKQVLFEKGDVTKETRIPSRLEGKKSAYDLLGNLSSYHIEVNQKINELQLLKSQKKSDIDSSELDQILEQLEKEKEDIDQKIVRYVVKNVVEGKDELFKAISVLENKNMEMETTINFLKNRVDYLKDTVTALLVENQSLKRGSKRQSTCVRRSVVEKVSLLLPKSLRQSSSLDSEKSNDIFEDLFFMEQEDIISVEKSTMDSFMLDAALATWHTDKASIQEQVRRIGKDLEVMEVNQMKLNLLKRYVHRHGAKYINRHTFIDPTKGMSLWHS